MAIDSRGTVGGKSILWNPAELTVEGCIGLHRILTRFFRQARTKEKVLILVVYEPPVPGEREEFLESIWNLSNMYQ